MKKLGMFWKFAMCAAAFAADGVDVFAADGVTQEILIANEIEWGGGTTNWVDGDLVITYTNETGKFYLPGVATVDILEVGGGGGGGRVCNTNSTDYGGGGGGGGGGVVTNKGLLKLKGRYTITVGRGGAAAEYVKDGWAEGGDGGNTFITNDKDGSNVMEVAIGGGGGGALSAGHNGGCGGGGSKNVTESNGGVGSQGYDGGIGKAKFQGASGGGAGSVGKSTSKIANPVKAGDGLAISISGTEVYYAGGGVGGNSYKTIKGSAIHVRSKGGGGDGGGGKTDDDAHPATDGIDGLGGGGGGGGRPVVATAGRGGCGVLIIRITSYVEKEDAAE